MKSYWTLVPAIALMFANIVQAELYRWVDENGKIHYSDTPPPPSARRSDRKRIPGNAAASPALPYELQQAVKNFPVTLFVTDCGEGCTQARALLAKRGVPHTELDATDPGAQEQLKKVTGGRLEVPVLVVGREALRGFQPDQWNRTLSAAGYPMSALVKVTPTKPRPSKPQIPVEEDAQDAQGAPEAEPEAAPENSDASSQ
jgi:hypothetical protein